MQSDPSGWYTGFAAEDYRLWASALQNDTFDLRESISGTEDDVRFAE
jgi:hypothetical protein